MKGRCAVTIDLGEDRLGYAGDDFYEALLEGLVLFLVLWIFSSKPRPTMAVSGLFLLAYGLFRFAVEFVRLPDEHIGYLAWGWLTMGHLLTLPMIICGAVFMAYAYRRTDGKVSW